MKKPMISVIMGVYNGSKHIQNAIFSILAQSFKDFELIIINDGSTDDTLSKISAISDPRLIVIDQNNQGLTRSLNNALKIAKGDYIARQDADDISIYNRFEKQLAAFEEDKELSLVGSSMFISNPNGIFNEIFHYPKTDAECKSALIDYNPFIHGAIMMKRSELIDEGGYNENFRYVQDYELWSRLVPKIKCENLAEPLYARLRESDCSESTIDKTEYVNKIQNQLKNHENIRLQRESFTSKEITTQGIYPLLSYPHKYTSQLALTFSKMAKIARDNDLQSTVLKRNALFYCPWFGVFKEAV
ncbi:glycosyltransferase family 2 protein [Opacimonas viscosa]|uniref:Glycosyltransferase n=1 Tax=Opacimonas viscosa TaxID=2961944 RepID=A0AA42BL60_9ALTE|nr:glycosyltransferase [Opacimonas viscosa]MCP3428498.1 glycosyltransferase [Opacimonas viscosa]